MRQVPVHFDQRIASSRRGVLGALSALRTLDDVLTWARAQAPPWSVVEIVTQDEYTHDVVAGNGGDTYLVFDTT
jgi:hypothetical protein